MRFSTSFSSVAGTLLLVAPRLLEAQAPPTVQLQIPRSPVVTLQLEEVARIGSLDGERDAFGRIMDVDVDSRGRIIIADDYSQRIVVFDRNGRFVGEYSHPGMGPAEIEMPWAVTVSKGDSIFVWDAERARINVLTPDLEYARGFRIPPQWLITNMEFLPDGRVLVSSFGTGERRPIQVMNREGGNARSFGPELKATPELGGYAGSLLGGVAIAGRSNIVYTNKSPYEIYFFDSASGQPTARCIGAVDWTTEPAAVVVNDERGSGLRWGRFVHSSRILELRDGMYLNVILDPVNDRRILDVIDSECRLLTRRTIDQPFNPVQIYQDRLVAIQTLEYPEVVIYRLEVNR